MEADSNILIDWVERYHFGLLTTEEKVAFEKKLADDASFRLFAENHLFFLNTIKDYKAIQALKAKFNQAHQSQNNRQLLFEAKSPKLKFTEFILNNKVIIGVASCFLILFSFTFLYINRSSVKSGTYELMLRREVANIKRSQSNLANKVNSIEKGYKSSKRENFAGTGFAISNSGYILTNYHVINGADSLYIENSKGDIYKVKTVTASPEYDLAILKIDDSKFKQFNEIPYVFKRNLSKLGERVYTLGFPKDEPVYGEGYLSASSGYDNDTTSYQLSLSVNPGNSGGPLFNENGEVIGVISGKQAMMDGFTFAVKSNYLYNTIKELNADSLIDSKVVLPKKNILIKEQRTAQIEKIKDFVFMVKVYN